MLADDGGPVGKAPFVDACTTQLKAQGPSRTCNESKEADEEGCYLPGDNGGLLTFVRHLTVPGWRVPCIGSALLKAAPLDERVSHLPGDDGGNLDGVAVRVGPLGPNVS